VLPGAAFLEMACICGNLAAERRVTQISDVVWIQPVSFRAGPRALQTHLKHIGDNVEYAVTSLDGHGERVVHCEGRLAFRKPRHSEASIVLEELKQQLPDAVSAARYYEEFGKHGLQYGAAFRTLQAMQVGSTRALAKLVLPPHLKGDFDQFILHPSIIDGALQAVAGLAGNVEANVPYLPFALDEVEILRAIPRTCYAYVEAADAAKPLRGIHKFNIQLLNERGELLLRLKHLHVRAQLPALHTPSVAG
jgi:polyketide synthase PksL